MVGIMLSKTLRIFVQVVASGLFSFHHLPSLVYTMVGCVFVAAIGL